MLLLHHSSKDGCIQQVFTAVYYRCYHHAIAVQMAVHCRCYGYAVVVQIAVYCRCCHCTITVQTAVYYM